LANSSEPLLASCVRRLLINFHTIDDGSVSSRGQAHLFAEALERSIPFLPCIRRLEIIAWKPSRPSGFDFSGICGLQRTNGLEFFTPAIIKLWEHLAPTIRDLRVDVYMDALQTIAALDSRYAPELVAVDLRVHGGNPSKEISSTIGDNLTGIAQNLILPAADHLKSLRVWLAPCGHSHYVDGQLQQSTTVPDYRTNGFFKMLVSGHFVSLHSLTLKVAFTVLGAAHIARLVALCVRNGDLRSLTIKPPSPQGEPIQSPAYDQLMSDQSAHWGGLHTLSLFCPPSVFVRPNVEVVESLLPLPAVSSSLQELALTGRHFENIETLRTTLQMLRLVGSAEHLQKLSIGISIIRPSVLDELAMLVPSITVLHLRLLKAGPDDEVPPAILERVKEDERIREERLRRAGANNVHAFALCVCCICSPKTFVG
jgi:hypothetical protein